MEYYGLRKTGDDIDLVVAQEDLARLVKMYPTHLKDLWGDLGVAVGGFEVWKSVNYFDYDYLSQGAVEESNFLVISLEKLLLQKALTMQEPKYSKDLELVVKKITANQSSRFEEMKQQNQKMIAGLSNIKFIKKIGPEITDESLF